MKRPLLYILYIIIISFYGFSAKAQNNPSYIQYIETYKWLAIEEMQRYHIPASITLAQGLLESGAGQSILAVQGNNHFGIKVGSTWTGPYIVKSDDRPNDRFRKYNSVEESYEDHSRFLQKTRYQSLFQLDPTDYVGWAHGLKAAGYATNPKYASVLINIIESYNLAQYDHLADPNHIYIEPEIVQRNQNLQEQAGRRPMLCNDVVYIIARPGDTYQSISKEMKIKASKLVKYNEVDKHHLLRPGEIVFLGKKKSHVAKPIRKTYHVVREGESMHFIAQQYGIKLSCLYKWNELPYDFRPKPGMMLKLK